MPDPIRVGVSTCLLGEAVRHDGGHKRAAFVTDRLGPYVEYRPVCPELGMGMPVPREPIRLVRAAGEVRLVGTRSGLDHTEAMQAFAADQVARLKDAGLSGYILKKDSPSCGLERVKLYGPSGMPDKVGRGLYAEALVAAFPDLPMEEDGRLNDPRLRENFVERLFAYHRLTGFLKSDWTVGDLVAFHTREKLLLMAHDPAAYKALGRMVGEAKGRHREDLAADYRAGFMAAMRVLATVGRHTNVLQHMAGYVSDALTGDARAELSGLIDDYRAGLVPLIVPVTLIRHHARAQGVDYLTAQTYLAPHPKELMIRNHV